MKKDIDQLEELICSYNSEKDLKKKHVTYLKLVEEALKLVNKIAASMYPITVSVAKEDLIQVGAIGLLKSISTYKVQDKGSFRAYASKFIKGKILQYLRDKANIVKPPRETFENTNIVKKYIESHDENENLSVKDISRAINISESKVQEILNADKIKNIISLDQKIYSTDGVETLADRIQSADEKDFEYNFENKKFIEYALSKLPKDQRLAIYRFYIEEQTKKSIAQELNISQTQVARLIKRALNKMYDIIKSDMDIKEEI